MMKLKEGECRIYYKLKGATLKLDNEIEKLLKSWGFKRWASGLDLCDGIRDLCFEKEGNDGNKKN